MKLPSDDWLQSLPIPGSAKTFLLDPSKLIALPVVLILLSTVALFPSQTATMGPAPGSNEEEAAGLMPGETNTVTSTTDTAADPLASPTAAVRRGRRVGGSTGEGPNPTVAQGVTDTEIKLVYAYMHESCGFDPSAFVDLVAPNRDPELSIKTAVDYFNKRPLEVFGNDIPETLKSQLRNGYYGRTVKPIIVDDHGQFCLEAALNDAKQAAEKHKPFASIGGTDLVWDDVMTQNGTVRVTGRPALDVYFRDRRPYLWGPITGASQINNFLGQYAGKYLKGQKSIQTGDAKTANKDRVYGVYFHEDPETRKGIDDLKEEFKKNGVSIKTSIAYEPKIETIGEHSRNSIRQFIADGVTSIVMAMDPIALQFITQAADAEGYRPEWISSTWGLADGSAIPRTFMTRLQQVNTFGISVFFPSRQVEQEEQEAYLAWKKVYPDREPPGDWAGWYLSTKTIFRGIALAGRDLNAASFERGLNQHCRPCHRTNDRDPAVGYGPGDFTAVDDAHIQRYDPNEPDRTAPKSCREGASQANCWAGGQPPRGAYVYLEGGKRFFSFG